PRATRCYVLVLAALTLSARIAHAAEPGFLGKPLSQWQTELTDRQPKVRRAAAFALGKIGPPAAGSIPDLVRALKDSEATVREAAASALGEIGPADNRKTLPALMDALHEDADSAVRRSAAVALGSYGIRAVAATPQLLQALADREAVVRQ